MRGTPERSQADDAVAGLIPARAGNTATERGQAREPSAHPRSRGEHGGVDITGSTDLGSSPLTRGTHCRIRSRDGGAGLIPAHTGNTRKPTPPIPCVPAHPRSRGEHGGATPYPTREVGSSPLARGTPFASKQGMQANGLIPARAGNTFLPGAR